MNTKQILAGLILSLATTVAGATIINDNYVGSDFGGDVLGTPSEYEIQSMDVSLIGGTKLSVTINTNFAGLSGTLLNSSTFGNTGIGYGDLFISSTWAPFGSAPYGADDNSTGTVWSYGFSLDDRFVNNNTTGTLYSLNSGNNNADALLSDDFIAAGSFRHGQEVAVDVNGGDVTAVAGNSGWNVSPGQVNFLIDLTGTSLLGSDTFALHWGMSCANDVIEGEYTVPEPAVIGLLALGLIGIGFSRRK